MLSVERLELRVVVPVLENRKWKVVKSENILHLGEWLSVRIAITKDGKFVMEDQYRHALGQTCYEIVAGVVDPGETPLHAAQRELSEETGYGGGTWELFMTLSPNPTNHNNLVYTFLARDVEKLSEQHQEATEDINVHIFTRDEVREILDRGMIVQALMAAPLWKYFAAQKDLKI